MDREEPGDAGRTATLIYEALDGRPQTWLAARIRMNAEHLNRVLHGHRPVSQALYDKCRLHLPTLPPWPEEERADTAA